MMDHPDGMPGPLPKVAARVVPEHFDELFAPPRPAALTITSDADEFDFQDLAIDDVKVWRSLGCLRVRKCDIGRYVVGCWLEEWSVPFIQHATKEEWWPHCPEGAHWLHRAFAVFKSEGAAEEKIEGERKSPRGCVGASIYRIERPRLGGQRVELVEAQTYANQATQEYR